MEYSIKKIHNRFERPMEYSYAAIKHEKHPMLTGLLTPWLASPEEVIDYMDKKSQECLIDPKTARRGVK